MLLSVDKFIANLKNSRNYSESTQAAYSNDIQQYVEYFEDAHQRLPTFSDFNNSSISMYIDQQRKAGRKRSTLLRRRAALCNLGRFLHQQDLIDEIPLTEKVIVPSKPRKRIIKVNVSNTLNDKQISRIMQQVKSANSPRALRDFSILSLLLETGLSIGCLLSIDLDDLEISSSRVFVSPEGVKAGYWLWLKQCIQPLNHYKENGRPNLTDSRIEQALFVSQMGGRMSRQAIWQAFRKWGYAAKLKITLSPRLIRHTAAKRMRAKGLSIPEIQRYLGHSNPDSTRALLHRLNV